MADASVVFNILAVNDTEAAFGEVEDQMDSLSKGAKLLGEAFAAEQLFDWGKEIVDAGQEAQSTINSTNQLLAQMGTQAGTTGSQVQEVSEKIGEQAGVVGSSMQTALNSALGSSTVEAMFKSNTVSVDEFAQAVADMSSKATDGKNTTDSLTTAAKALGKAFTDPATGATALKKAGVLLTAAQIAGIKATEKQNGVMAAQKELYADLNTVIGGQAAATVPATAKIGAAMDTLKEKIGVQLLPTIAKLSQDLVALVGFISAHSQVFEIMAGVVLSLAGAFTAVKVAAGIASVATEAFDAVVKDGSITTLGWVGIIVLVVEAFVILWTHSQTFRDIVHAVINDVKGFFLGLWATVQSVFHSVQNAASDVISFIKNNWHLLLAILLGPFGLFIDAVQVHWNALKNMVSSVVGWIRAAWHPVQAILTDVFSAAWAVIKPIFDKLSGWVSAFGSGMKALGGIIASVWNGIESTISGVFRGIEAAFNDSGLGKIASVLGTIGSAGGSALGSVGHFFGFATGGTVGQGGYAIVGENGPELVALPGGTQVIPNGAATVASRSTSVHAAPGTMVSSPYGAAAGGTAVVTFDLTGVGTDEFVKALRKAIRIKGGNVQTVLGGSS